MRIQTLTNYSVNLNKQMRINVYGHYGVSIILFPREFETYNSVEQNGLLDTLRDLIDMGKIKLICVEDDNYASFFKNSEDYELRAENAEKYYKYIIEEVLPEVYRINEGPCLPYLLGCSMGSVLASIIFFRNPQEFSGLLGLSGIFDTTYFFKGWCDKTLYYNSPMLFLRDLSTNDKRISEYSKKRIILCSSENNWEYDMKKDFDEFRRILLNKKISAWVDYYAGEESNWNLWREQIAYFLPFLIER